MIKKYKADLHIHSVLSPCGDLEMSPQAVMQKAKEEGVQILAITDHNSLANIAVYEQKATEFGIKLIYGCEIQTSEEIHLIALFPTMEDAMQMNQEIHVSLLPLKNDPEFFGDQVKIDCDENIVGFEETALINSVIWSLDETFAKVEEHNGFVYPAHVDAATYSIISQLGFIPENLNIPVVEISAKCDLGKLLKTYEFLAKYAVIRSSDAHYIKDIASGFTNFYIEEPSLTEIILACKRKRGRFLEVGKIL